MSKAKAATSARRKAIEQLLKSRRPRSALETAALTRQLRDLDEGHRRGLVWDEAEAQRNVAFFGLLKHWKGRWAGLPLTLESWQEHGIIAPLFGWKRQDGTRRFRTAYIELPRKNGKTTICAGVGLQGLIADREQGAEVYAAATKRDQAKILFTDAKRCIGHRIKHATKEFVGAITCPATASTFQPLSSDYNSLDGLNVHRAIVDEVHAHKERGLWDVLVGGTGARTQPLVAAITTAGNSRNTICWELHEISRGILESSEVVDDAFFSFLAGAEEGDDWKSPSTWAKANPNLDISVMSDFLADLATQAAGSPTAVNNFMQKHLNIWVSGIAQAIDMRLWDECSSSPIDETTLYGRECFAGLDLATTRDPVALVYVFPPEPGDKRWIVLPRFFVPADNIDERTRQDRGTVKDFAARGLITATEGNETDYEAILQQFTADGERFNVRELAYDPWNASSFIQQVISAGYPADQVIKFPQTVANFCEPTKRLLDELIPAGHLDHGGHPVLRWMASNLAVRTDPSGNRRPDKQKSSEKIDGIVAALMALGRAIVKPKEEPSVYEQPGNVAC